MRSMLDRLFFAALLLGCAAAPAMAQVTGRMLVRVVDEQQAIMPGVAVTIASPALVGGQMSATTDAGGVSSFPSLPPGVYAVRVELVGFQSVVREEVVVSVGQTTPLIFALRLATLEETVTVTGESPIIDTTNANVSVTISQELLQQTPGGHNIFALAEYKVPGLVAGRPDVGGAEGGLQVGLTVRGTPNSQTTQFLNGINVTDGGAAGATQYYYDYDTFEEVQVGTGALDLSVPGSGVFVNMVTKSGGDRFNGRASFSWSGDATQGTNVDEGLLRYGLRSDAGAVEFISDGNMQAGGPLIPNKLRLFTSFRDWRTHRNVPGFPEVEETNIWNLLFNLTWQPTPSHRLTGFFGRNYYDKPNRGASAFNAPVSVSREDDVMSVYQAHWNWVATSRAFVDARWSYAYMYFPLYLKSTDQSLFDQATQFVSRAAQQESKNYRRRFQGNANFQYYVDRALGGRHELRFGVDHGHVPVGSFQNRNDDVNPSWNSATGRGTEVSLFNSPIEAVATIDSTALFAQDTYTVGRVSLAGGVRWERLEGYLPAQQSPPSRWFPALQRNFEPIRDILNWTSIGPRLNVVYDLRGTGKTALKASAGRYYYTIATSTPNAVNPNSTVSERYAWDDFNGDLRFQPGEAGRLLGRTGTLNTSFDSAIERPYTDEITAGVDHELFPNFRLSAVFIYRDEKQRFGTINVGVPFSAYSAVTVVDPGRDGTLGTADDIPNFTVYNQDPATLGADRFLIANDELFDSTFRGFEITGTKRLSNRWTMLAGYTFGRTRDYGLLTATYGNIGSLPSPNALVNALGPPDADITHMVKLTGTYTLPYDVQVSGNFRTQSGKPITRQARFTLNQGSTLVNVEPRGSERLDQLTTIDMRLTRAFTVGGKRLELYGETYNLTNANTVWDVRTLTGRIGLREGGVAEGALINQQQYGSPIQILGPRIFRFGAAIGF